MQIDEKADAWLEDERTSTLYQVIGSLAEAAGVFDDPHVIRALDLAAYGKTQDGGDVLPFCPAYESAKQKGEAEGWRPISDEPLEALAHARTTAANDDISKPGTVERERHCQRIAAMQSASEEIVKLRAILALIRPAFEAKEREIERATNNRDMWKGQCDRQAKTLFELRMQMLADEGQSRER